MDELVFCCTQCLCISETGILTNSISLRRSPHRPIRVTCRQCSQPNRVALQDFLITVLPVADGRFVQFGDAAAGLHEMP